MGVTFSQFFPPHPTLTERNLPSQSGKVFIVTGGASGIGYSLATILYGAGGKVYIAGRSEPDAQRSIERIKAGVRDSSSVGQLYYLYLDLDDLSTIKSSAEAFKLKEPRLHVIFNNAGVSLPPVGSISKQGHELQIATNCLGPYLFTQLLLPSLRETAKSSSGGCVRIVWTSSLVVDLTAPHNGAIMSDVISPSADQNKNYTISKLGNWFLASEVAASVAPDDIISVTQNPGNLKTNLLRHTSTWMQLSVAPLLYEAKMGAYTGLWAGLSPDVTLQLSGSYVIPWGRIHPSPRSDLMKALKRVEDGGSGEARTFRDWCDKETVEFR